jgi:hypothetical protein
VRKIWLLHGRSSCAINNQRCKSSAVMELMGLVKSTLPTPKAVGQAARVCYCDLRR